jgi:tyrosyl-tRNA synthetase
MFGKTMSIPDDLIPNWFELCTDVHMDVVKELTAPGKNPRDAKVELAKQIVTLYHSPQAAEEAERYFVETFSKRQQPVGAVESPIPSDLADPIPLANLIVALQMAKSNGNARDLIKQGAVSLNDEKVLDPFAKLDRADLVGKTLRVGRHQFRKLQ